MRHIHICDPQLAHHGGHYLSHDAQLVAELQRRNLPVSIYGRRGGKVSVCGVEPAPVFTFDIFQEAATDAHVWAIENFHTVNEAFLADLCRIGPDRLSSDDLVYFPNLLQNQLYAVALWLKRLPPAQRPAVAVMLRYLNHAMDYVQSRANKDLIALYYRYATRMLRAVQPRSILCADTRELAAVYTELTGEKVIELPNPMDVSALLGEATPSTSGGRRTVVYQGHTSPQRGFHFLPEIIERCLRHPSPPRFVVHIQNREGAAIAGVDAHVKQLDRMAGADVRIVDGALSQPDYLALLKQADIVLLPYSPRFYGAGSSGVFTEAASVGKVIVVSPNTVPARQGKEFDLGIVTASDWTASAMASAVAEAARDFPNLQSRSQAAAPRFREDQCARTLWDRLLAAVPSAATAAKIAA